MSSMMMTTPQQAARRLSQATGRPVTEATVRRWCRSGLGLRVAGRWSLPERAIADVEQKLRACGSSLPGVRP